MASAGGSAIELAFGLGCGGVDFRVAKAIYQVIIHHPDRLHERITNRWAYKFEAAFKQVAAHFV